MTQPGLVVVGFGMACAHLLQTLFDVGYQGPITVVGDEAAYNRIDLITMVGGGQDPAPLLGPPVLNQKNLSLRLGVSALRLDRRLKTIELSGSTLAYEKLVLATGGEPVRPDIPGLDLPGVHLIRTVADVRRIREDLSLEGPVVILGGGVLGLETADSLLGAGKSVTLIQAQDQVLETRIDAPSAHFVEAHLRKSGLNLITGDGVVKLAGDGRVERVALASGKVLDAGVVIVCTGIFPRVKLAREAGLATKKGVVVDEKLTTSDPSVFAVGDVCEFEGRVTGLIAPAYEQARVLAQNLCGQNTSYSPHRLSSVRLKSRVELLVLGEPDSAAGAELVENNNPWEGTLQKLWIRDDRLVKAVLAGTATGMTLAEAHYRSGNVLPRPLSRLFEASDPRLWPAEQVLCACHQVTVGAFRNHVKGAARAGQGCGSCLAQVKELEAGLGRPRERKMIRGYTQFAFAGYVIDYVMSLGFLVSLVTGILKFPGLLGALGISLRTMPMPLIMDLHDWGSLAFTAAALLHLGLHWNPMIKFGVDLFKKTPRA